MQENTNMEITSGDLRPIHLYFTNCIPPSADTEEFKLVEPTLERRLIYCTSWPALAELMRLYPKSICISEYYFRDHSFIEVFSMFDTFTKMTNRQGSMSISLGIRRDTPYSLIKEAQKSKIIGIIPTSDDFSFDDTLRGIHAQWANIPYWPKNIIEQLPGAKKTKEKKVDVKLTDRQQQIFDIVITRGCSNKHIAKLMGLSESTVKLHLSNIFKKYGVKNRTQLAVFSKGSSNEA